MAEHLIFDCESDNLIDALTVIHSIQVGLPDSDDVTLYTDALPGYPPLAEGLARIKAAAKLICHNGIGFDFAAINKIYPGTLRREQIIDTLVAARLWDAEERENSLRAWGLRLGVFKGEFAGPYDTFTQEFADYSTQDIVTTRAVWHKVKAVLEWGESFQLETDTAWAIREQIKNGFRLDVKAAEVLEVELRAETEAIKLSLRDIFPAIWVPTEKAPFVPKKDSKTGYVAGCPVTKVSLELFNPASRKQIAERFRRMGWRPKLFGADGTPTIDESVLVTLPYPEAKRLVTFYERLKMLGQISDGKNGWLKLVRPTGRIHGDVNPNGTATGRMAHSRPNVAQANKDKRMRAVWLPREGWKLVGIDADGLEARTLAHYLTFYDGGDYRDALLTGSSKDGTDVHSRNMRALNAAGLGVDREGAKRELYAYIYGAGDSKLGWTVRTECRRSGGKLPPQKDVLIGRMARAALSVGMPGLDKLAAAIQAKVKSQGYLQGLDGRRIPIRSEHSALNFLLQGAGAIVMKKALCLFLDTALVHEDWPDMGLCAQIHDEAQIECAPELAEAVGSTYADCIKAAGEHFGLRCPMAGNFKIGDNWSQTH